MEDHSTKLVETLYTNSRINMDFFMPLPTGNYINKDRDGIRFNHYPMISLNCKRNYTNEEYYDFAKATFRITVNNHYQVIEFFNTLMKWLFDDEFNDLFLIGPTNKLMFNADYKSLHITVPFYQRNGTQVLSAVPSIVQLDERLSEGVNLYVNTTEYMIPLTFKEVGIVFSILKEFNFSAEVTKLLSMYDYAIKHNAVRPSVSETKTPFD